MRQYIKYYFSNNIIEYLKLFCVFTIGVVVSIFVIINSNNDVFNNSLKRNFKDFVFIVFLASTVIGIPFVYWIIAKKAFSIGYTISAIFATQNTKTAIIFICNSMLIHNIMYMVSIFVVLVAGVNFVKSFFANKKVNIRFEIFKYLIFVLIASLIVIMSSLFEAYVSTNFLYLFKKYL